MLSAHATSGGMVRARCTAILPFMPRSVRESRLPMLAFWHAPYRWPIAENVRAVEGLSLGASWVSSSALKPLYPLPPHANRVPNEPR